jgi:hypothetical protein
MGTILSTCQVIFDSEPTVTNRGRVQSTANSNNPNNGSFSVFMFHGSEEEKQNDRPQTVTDIKSKTTTSVRNRKEERSIRMDPAYSKLSISCVQMSFFCLSLTFHHFNLTIPFC